MSAKPGNTSPLFGKALAFYSIDETANSTSELLVINHPLVELDQVLYQWQGIWAPCFNTARVSSIQAIVGIWKGTHTKQIHILCKHPVTTTACVIILSYPFKIVSYQVNLSVPDLKINKPLHQLLPRSVSDMSHC